MTYRLTILLLLTLTLGAAQAAAQEATAVAPIPEVDRVSLLPAEGAPDGAECAGDNLLTNPSFEGQYSGYIPPNGHPDCPAGICQTAQMAPGWTPWWRSHDPADPGWIIRMPEYKPADPDFDDPPRVRSGDAAQQYFTFFATHEAGFYQKVAATPGVSYCFSIWGHSWSADDDDDAYSGPMDGLLDQKIGIDPTGGEDWQSPDVIWSAPRRQYDFYGLFAIEAIAQAAEITVFTYSQPAYAVKHNDVYWDDAFVSAAGSMDPTEALTFLADVGDPGNQSQAAEINLEGDPSLTWTAVLSPGGSLPPANITLTPTSGGPDDDLTVTVNTTGLAVADYAAAIRIDAGAAIPGSPATIDVLVIVAPELFAGYIPQALRP